MRSTVRLLTIVVLFLPACGARTGALGLDPEGVDAGRRDAPSLDARRDTPELDAPDAPRDVPGLDAPDAPRDTPPDVPTDRGCIPVDDRCAGERCGDGEDGDCDGMVDEECACEPGAVQICFPGPPGRRGVGACTDGTQTCGLSGTWGPCEGGIGPREDVCNGLDNLCDGCSERRDCPIDCPGPDDPRIADLDPFDTQALVGRSFYPGMARSWRWSVEGGPCDGIAPGLNSFELESATSETARFTPRLSGDYTVTLEVVTVEGTRLSCEWVQHVRGPGLRIEMCYPESETQDLDLVVHEPGSVVDWYPRGGTARDITRDACSWANCEAMVRGGPGWTRADWGYMRSPLSECENGPQGAQWRALGFCANPRLDIDNNLSEGVGLPENINIDAPGDGETFRVMVQNWTGTAARPIVNVYCAGRRIATYGAAPDIVPGYSGRTGDVAPGAMWRVVDVTTRVAPDGTLTCDAAALHPPGATTGYYVTYDDGRY
jgi:hypothetical protein